MKKTISIVILLVCLLHVTGACAMVLIAGRPPAAVGETTYYLGFPDSVETESAPSATPNNSVNLTTGDRFYCVKLTIPAGSTLTGVWVYFGSNYATATTDVRIFLQNGALLGAAESLWSITPSANSWVEATYTSGTTVYGSETGVVVGIALDNITNFDVYRNSTGDNYYFGSTSYPPLEGDSLSSQSQYLAVALEYTR